MELSSDNQSAVLSSPPQYTYSTAESAIEITFLDGFKHSSSAIHQSLSLIVVDESHILWKPGREKGHLSIVMFTTPYRMSSFIVILLRNTHRELCKCYVT